MTAVEILQAVVRRMQEPHGARETSQPIRSVRRAWYRRFRRRRMHASALREPLASQVKDQDWHL